MPILFFILLISSHVLADELGDGIDAYKKQDYKKSLVLFKSAALQGDVRAQYNLGLMYMKGEGVIQDYKEAAKWYKLAAEQGHEQAQVFFGNMCGSGEGVIQDYKEAAKWYKLAAEQGNATAQSLIGLVYLSGQGVTKDQNTALKWLKLASEDAELMTQTNAVVLLHIGNIYRDGGEVKQDYKEAFKYFNLASEYRNAEAQTNLGGLYHSGFGVLQNEVMAYMWFNIAAANGDIKSVNNRSIVANNMSPQQLEQAQELARKCIANNYKNCGEVDSYFKKSIEPSNEKKSYDDLKKQEIWEIVKELDKEEAKHNPQLFAEHQARRASELKEINNEALSKANKEINHLWAAMPNDLRTYILPEQREWLKQRELDCIEVASEYGYNGTTANEAGKLGCMASMTNQRMAVLQQKIADIKSLDENKSMDLNETKESSHPKDYYAKLKSNAKWKEVGSSDTLTIYVDLDSLKKEDDLIKVHTMYDFRTTQKVGVTEYLSMTAQEQFDCRKEQHRPLVLREYSGHMGYGENVNGANFKESTSPWSSNVLGSVNHSAWKIVCEKSGQDMNRNIELSHEKSNTLSNPSKQSTGTAFIVSSNGNALTNYHVVYNCTEVKISGRNDIVKVIGLDGENDLALLQLPYKSINSAKLNPEFSKLRQGEDVIVFGYPLNSVLSSGGNLTLGTLSALTGLGNNTNQVQITAPIQPGSSGSPVMDRKGNLVGVVSMKLDDVKMVEATGQVGQNVNFAVNEQTVKLFLENNNVPYKFGGGFSSPKMENADIADEARKWTIPIECWK